LEAEPSVVCGTPGYIAPELLSKTYYGTKADIFSIGSVFYSLLTGFCLIDGDTCNDVLKKNKCFRAEDVLESTFHLSEAISNLL